MLNRRALLLAFTPAVACRQQPGSGFHGYAFVTNEAGRSVAAIDLTTFSVRKQIGIDGNPTAVIAHGSRAVVYVLTPQNGTIHEIDAVSLSVKRKARIATTASSMRMAPGDRSIWILCRDSRSLVRLTLDRFAIEARIKLSGVPQDFDLSSDGQAAISFPAEHSVALTSLESGRIDRVVALPSSPGVVRFRFDGMQVLTGNRTDRTVSCIDVQTGRIVVHLPLAIDPENFCFKLDGGELYVTGAGMDAVAVIYPYYSQVYATRLIGRSPGAMAVSPSYLFVANTESGNVTVVDIATGKVNAVVAVGAEPRHIAVTPDNEYALVLNQRSGDMAVIRIAAFVSSRRAKTAPSPLLTMIPVGSKPVSTAVLPT